MSSGSFKNLIHKLWVYKSYISNIYKQDLALNNRPRCHKTQPINPFIQIYMSLKLPSSHYKIVLQDNSLVDISVG